MTSKDGEFIFDFPFDFTGFFGDSLSSFVNMTHEGLVVEIS